MCAWTLRHYAVPDAPPGGGGSEQPDEADLEQDRTDQSGSSASSNNNPEQRITRVRLTKALLESSARDHAPRSFRVTVRTIAGTWIGIIGMGELLKNGDDERLTIGNHMRVQDILAYERHNWCRWATQAEMQEDPRWWRLADFRPTSFVFSDGTFAQHFQPIGLRGPEVTAVDNSNAEPEVFPDEPLITLDHVSTPPTPPHPASRMRAESQRYDRPIDRAAWTTLLHRARNATFQEAD